MTTTTRLEWTVLDTEIGPLMLAATERGLVSVSFHARASVRDRVLGQLREAFGCDPVESDRGLLAEPVVQMRDYLAGARRDFELPLDWSLTQGFSREVLAELATGVPYGTVVAYGDLAARLGQPQGAQAVGVAMGSNPLPVVVPCHRVVGSDGRMVGFGGGLDTKRQLLALEGVLPQPLF
ncbi:methylated-DNA--[protein]-cysteine S-methyltransferase [Luteipulveratus sp. YIM 133132]|uniref:methylated-DNA--[protein]-cysteine S-methyltransferase n=1 Tax=Luteipulveratus flavus TaxID=3031728 RepID=UPI0023AF133F|nr:methylated-DNA--[protein]-cysteine S-methyltransferase [Luteipulveratus sp. YIM 133132]MDE9366999.1 methylated-DNA--[protein]-cysteine S-methyltransferase [Luteipulveratus sp. YIM 133132]